MFTMKKVFIYILLLPLFAIFFASCNSDDIVVPVSPAELKKQTLVNVLSEQSYSPQQFVDTLGAPTMTAIMEYIYPESPVLAKILEEAKLLSRQPPARAGQTVCPGGRCRPLRYPPLGASVLCFQLSFLDSGWKRDPYVWPGYFPQ